MAWIRWHNVSSLLQTILFGTFVPPDVPGRKIDFDAVKKPVPSLPVAKRKRSSRDSVIAIMEQFYEWHTVREVSALSGACYDTSKKVLAKLAGEHIVSKRYRNVPKQGPKTAVYRWINKNAKKQKAA